MKKRRAVISTGATFSSRLAPMSACSRATRTPWPRNSRAADAGQFGQAQYNQSLSGLTEPLVGLAVCSENLPEMLYEGPPRMSEDLILATEDLTKEFAGFTAVNGVSLR